MHRLSASLTVAVFAAVLVTVSFAQQASQLTVPNLIRYGGELRDANGVALFSATVGVTFAIYKQQDGGAPIWIETQNVTSDATGNYSALLGSTTAGMPMDIFSPRSSGGWAYRCKGKPSNRECCWQACLTPSRRMKRRPSAAGAYQTLC